MRPYYIIGDYVICRKENTLEAISKDKRTKIPVEDISALFCIGSITLRAGALKFLCRKGIPVFFFGRHGNYVGTLYPMDKSTSNEMLIRQVKAYLNEKERIKIAREMVSGILRNLRWFLRKAKYPSWKEIPKEAFGDSIEALMAEEANGWEHFYEFLREEGKKYGIVFEKREKRPPRGEINAMISYLNSMLYAVTVSEIMHTPLDPRIGFLHETYQKRFTLSLDIADIFKPIITGRIVLKMIRSGLSSDMFFEEIGTFLTNRGKAAITREFNNYLQYTARHPSLGRRVSLRRMIRLEAYKLVKHLLGESKYVAFTPWWRLMPYAIVVYDIGEERVSKVHNLLQRYLIWIQRSVFVGELPMSKVIEMERHLREIMNLDHDSVIIFLVNSRRLIKMRRVGYSKYKNLGGSNLIFGGERYGEEVAYFPKSSRAWKF